MAAGNEWRQQKEKTTENKICGESYLRKTIICKALCRNYLFNKNWLKVDKRLIKSNFEKRPDVVRGLMTTKRKNYL